jgi:hypothetical protein
LFAADITEPLAERGWRALNILAGILVESRSNGGPFAENLENDIRTRAQAGAVPLGR